MSVPRWVFRVLVCENGSGFRGVFKRSGSCVPYTRTCRRMRSPGRRGVGPGRRRTRLRFDDAMPDASATATAAPASRLKAHERTAPRPEPAARAAARAERVRATRDEQRTRGVP